MIDVIENNIEELKTLNESKQRFIDSLNHEIKTPITSIIGYSELLLKSNTSNNSLSAKIFTSSIFIFKFIDFFSSLYISISSTPFIISLRFSFPKDFFSSLINVNFNNVEFNVSSRFASEFIYL